MQTWVSQLLATVLGGCLTLGGTVLTLVWQARHARSGEVRTRALNETRAAISVAVKLRAMERPPKEGDPKRQDWDQRVEALLLELEESAHMIPNMELRSRVRRGIDMFLDAGKVTRVRLQPWVIRELTAVELEESLGAYLRDEEIPPRRKELEEVEAALIGLQVSRFRHPSSGQARDYDGGPGPFPLDTYLSELLGYRPRRSRGRSRRTSLEQQGPSVS